MRWSELSNGELLSAAENEFNVLITTDRQLRYQQNLSNRNLAICVLPSASWPKLRSHAAQIAAAVAALKSGEYFEFEAI